jgi:hypothetical protein
VENFAHSFPYLGTEGSGKRRISVGQRGVGVGFGGGGGGVRCGNTATLQVKAWQLLKVHIRTILFVQKSWVHNC